MPVGNCTNLIVQDAGYRGVLIALTSLRAMRLEPREDGGVVLNAEAGASLAELVRLMAEESLTGMEFCAGIPGSIGGGIRMNAGAYGHDMKDVVKEITVLDGGREFRHIPVQGLRFEYRNLRLGADTVIVQAGFLLQRGVRAQVRAKISELLEARKRKHPLQYPSAGSIFKNPQAGPAGRIIEECGLKGRRVGGAEVSQVHGNFIVNTGDARAADIVALMRLVREEVLEQTGVLLEPEVKVIGESDEEVL